MNTVRMRSALSGLIASGVSLGVAELFATQVSGGRSPVLSVGAQVINYTPAALKDWAIRTFGTADKAILIASVLTVVLIIGVAAGLLARKHISIGAIPFLIFGTLAYLASKNDPIVRIESMYVVLIASVIAGVATLWWLTTRAAASADGDAAAFDRRSFLVSAGGAAAFAGATFALGRRATRRVVASADRSLVVLPPAEDLAGPLGPSIPNIQGVSRLYTPNAEFYRIDTALGTPMVDLETWRLKIGGMVDRPYELSYDEIMTLPMVERDITISCVSNEVGGRLVGNARWQGVPLAYLLDKAGVQSDASQFVSRSVDGWNCGFPTEIALDGRDAILAVGMNGEPLPFAHGFPARIVVPGLYGYVSATKWISEIEMTTWDAFDGYWVPRGWAKEGPIKTESRIDAPRSRSQVPTGPYKVGGVAWAPHTGIAKVEVRVNEGEWVEGWMSDTIGDDSWRQWGVEVVLTTGQQVIEVRATDNSGYTQTPERVSPRPDGATGWHSVVVNAS